MNILAIEDTDPISKTLIIQGVTMPLAFILGGFVPIGWVPILSFTGVLYAIMYLSLLILFIYPLFQGHEVRNGHIQYYSDIHYWFRFSLVWGVLYILSVFLTNSTNWILLSLPALVYLISGILGETMFFDEGQLEIS